MHNNLFYCICLNLAYYIRYSRMVSQILFIALTLAAIVLFSYNLKKVIRNIRLGKAANRTDQPGKRLMTMLKVALGQTKMFFRPIPAFLHLIVYAGFVIINI